MFDWVKKYHEIRKSKAPDGEFIGWILQDQTRMHLLLDEFSKLADAYQALLKDPTNDDLGATAVQMLESVISQATHLGWQRPTTTDVS